MNIKSYIPKFFSNLTFILILLNSNNIISQDKPYFWDNVKFGGAASLNFGNGFFSGTLAPSAIYQFNPMFAAGLGIQGSYVKVNHDYSSIIYGTSLITLFNPIEQIQLSAELEQLRVNTTTYRIQEQFRDNFWTTALFLGIGYHAQNIAIGLRYNVLYDKHKTVYDSALMPFIRVFF